MVMTFCSPSNFENVVFKSEYMIGFDYDAYNHAYIVYLQGGGSVKIRAGYYEYCQLKMAMEDVE